MYPHYDIVIWSHTHWRWLETKLIEIGMIGGDRPYKVCFVSDASTMFTVSGITDFGKRFTSFYTYSLTG